MKNFSDTNGNQTCDLLACSVVPQPTVPLHAKCVMGYASEIRINIQHHCKIFSEYLIYNAKAVLTQL